MALYEKVYVVSNAGKVVAVMPGDTSQTDRTAMLTSYQTRNTGGIYSIVEVSVANLVNFNEINELIGKAVSSTGVISDYTPSSSIANAQRTTDWKYRLYNAFQVYNDSALTTSRQDWWPSMSGTNGTQALIATDKWAYQQIALGDLIADRTYGAGTTTEAIRETAIAHIVNIISTLGKTWYGVMLGNSGPRGSWAGSNLNDGGLIYSDIITASTLAAISPNGAFTPLSGATIPTGFKVDTPTLR